MKTASLLRASIPLLLLVGVCGCSSHDYVISGGDDKLTIASWKREEAFRNAALRLRFDESAAFCDALPGSGYVIYASRGHIEPRTVNVAEFWTVAFALPADIEAGQSIQLRWADYESTDEVAPGRIAATVYQNFSVQQHPRPGSYAGKVTVLSAGEDSLRLQLNVGIVTEFGSGSKQRALLNGELNLLVEDCKPGVSFRGWPENALQEVGTPSLGKHRYRERR